MRMMYNFVFCFDVSLSVTMPMMYNFVFAAAVYHACCKYRNNVRIITGTFLFSTNYDRNGFASTPTVTVIGNIATTEKG